MKIPIIFGWLKFHRKDQLCLCSKPILVCHWIKSSWMKLNLYSKRIFCIGKRDYPKDILDFHDDAMRRE